MRSPHGTTIRSIFQCKYYLNLFCVLINDVVNVPFHASFCFFVDSNLKYACDIVVVSCTIIISSSVSCMNLTSAMLEKEKYCNSIMMTHLYRNVRR